MKKSTDIQNNGFNTPHNYFENFNTELQTRIIEEQLKDKFGNKNPFSVPVNYFQNITANIKESKKPSVKIIQLLKPYLSIAAGILFVFGIWQVLLTNIDNSKQITIITRSERLYSYAL